MLHFNDPNQPDCIGWYRADKLDFPRCSPSEQDTGPSHWAWGYQDDARLGEGPAVSSGYVLITEMEQVYWPMLDMTLCVDYATQPVAENS